MGRRLEGGKRGRWIDLVDLGEECTDRGQCGDERGFCISEKKRERWKRGRWE